MLKNKKMTHSLLMLLLSCAILLNGCSSSQNKPDKETQKSSVQTETAKNNPSQELLQTEKNIELIQKAIKGSKEDAEKINNVLGKVGINTIDSFMKTTPNGCILNASKNIGSTPMVVYINPDNTVNKIVFKGANLVEDGKVIGNVSGGILTSAEESKAMRLAEREVKKILKDPNSAEFPSRYWVFKNNNIIEVSGFVSAKNSFNAMVKTKFWVRFDPGWKVLSIKTENQ